MNTAQLDTALETLAAAKTRWARLPIATKIYLLDSIRERIGTVAAEWVEASVEAKQIRSGSHLTGEEWTSGPFAVASAVSAVGETLRRIAAGDPILEGLGVRILGNGQVAVRVWPATLEDRLFLSGHTADVWMRPGIGIDDVERSAASFYCRPEPTGSVAVVLGAGNIASIAPLDVLTEMFTHGSVVAVKLNPINAYLRPLLEEAFAPLVDPGFLRFITGGVGEGAYLTAHHLVDRIHVTGAAATHDAIVYGTGSEAADRKAADRPLISTPVTSELGGVGPTIVVGGPWSKDDLRYQAEHIVSQKLHNHGFNCIACQVLILPAEWEQADDLLDAMREVVAQIDDRESYYPGSVDRHAIALAVHPDAEVLTDGSAPVTFVNDVDPSNTSDVCFRTEFFGAVLAVTRLPGADVPTYLDHAVTFANDVLAGNLGANVIIHPSSARAGAEAVDRAVDRLRYGTIAVNSWIGVAFAMNRATWGAFPGNARNDIQSGSGVVHNSLMLEGAERTVVHGSFAPFPRTLRQGVVHTGVTPPFFITNRQAARLGELLTERAVTGSWATLPKIVAAALRG